MARSTKVVTIQAPGRDQGKHFLITEMSAAQGAQWATRACLMIANANPEMPPGMTRVLAAGMEGLAHLGVGMLFRAPYERARPLLDELLGCVQRIEVLAHPFPRPGGLVVDPSNPDGDDVQEIGTYFLLQGEVFEVLTGFSIAAWIAESRAAAEEAASQSTQTSTGSSDSSSQPDSPPDAN